MAVSHWSTVRPVRWASRGAASVSTRVGCCRMILWLPGSWVRPNDSSIQEASGEPARSA